MKVRYEVDGWGVRAWSPQGDEWEWEFSELLDSVITTFCVECGSEVRIEPDAEEVWCDYCGKVVKVFNPVDVAMRGGI